MKLYHAHIIETDEHLCVAAMTTDEAAEVLVCFWVVRSGLAPGDFSIENGAPPAYRHHPTVQAVAAGYVAGVIVRQLDGSMCFEPAIGKMAP